MTPDVTGDVNDIPKESQASGDEPWRFTLRGKGRDKAIVQRVVEAHKRMGLTISLNDAVLVLIRRAATPDADSQEEAWRQIEQHWSECAHGCDYRHIKCPEGWRLYDAFHRVEPRRAGWRPPGARPSPAPPPPLPAAPEQPAEVAGWRRYFGFERKAS